MDQIKVGSAIILATMKSAGMFFCMLAGRMTPNQKMKVKKHCTIDTVQYCALSKWFIEKSGHTGFQNMPISDDCP